MSRKQPEPIAQDYDLIATIHTLLGKYMKDRTADYILIELRSIMADEVDGPELVRLMQKWMHAQ